MVEVTALWLPILLSAVFVFVASSVIHMVLTYHRSDYDKLPDEDAVLDALRAQQAGPGDYFAPHCVTPAEMKSPEIKAKVERGPIALITVKSGFAMGKQMISWFVYCLVLSALVAYAASLVLPRGVAFSTVFTFICLVAFLGYSGSSASESIWMGQKWSTTIKHIVDGLVYAAVTAATFGWLWPS